MNVEFFEYDDVKFITQTTYNKLVQQLKIEGFEDDNYLSEVRNYAAWVMFKTEYNKLSEEQRESIEEELDEFVEEDIEALLDEKFFVYNKAEQEKEFNLRDFFQSREK